MLNSIEKYSFVVDCRDLFCHFQKCCKKQLDMYSNVLAVARLSAPATTATHSRVIRLRRVLTDHPPSGSSIDPASVAV